MICITIENFLYLLAQGITLAGLIVVSIRGLEIKDKSIVNEVYCSTGPISSNLASNKISENDIRENAIEQSIKKRVQFGFGFLFSLSGILIGAIVEPSAPRSIIVRLIGILLFCVIGIALCKYVEYVYVKISKYRIIKKIKERKIFPDIEEGQAFIDGPDEE